MTAVYKEAKSSPCPLRLHFAAEAGWDIGGSLACLFAAAFYAYGASLQMPICLRFPWSRSRHFSWMEAMRRAKARLVWSAESLLGRDPPSLRSRAMILGHQMR